MSVSAPRGKTQNRYNNSQIWIPHSQSSGPESLPPPISKKLYWEGECLIFGLIRYSALSLETYGGTELWFRHCSISAPDGAYLVRHECQQESVSSFVKI
jgi:hypothetical protein